MTSISWGLYIILAVINVLAFLFVRYCLGKPNRCAMYLGPRFTKADHVSLQLRREARRSRRWRTCSASKRNMVRRRRMVLLSARSCFVMTMRIAMTTSYSI